MARCFDDGEASRRDTCFECVSRERLNVRRLPNRPRNRDREADRHVHLAIHGVFEMNRPPGLKNSTNLGQNMSAIWHQMQDVKSEHGIESAIRRGQAMAGCDGEIDVAASCSGAFFARDRNHLVGDTPSPAIWVYSTSEENYVKAIFHLQKDGTVTTNELSAELQTRPASVTDMMKKLRSKKLVHYKPYHGFKLSPEGNKVALIIIRRHRLWEFFLAEKLKFNWEEVHEVAEHLEHVSSKKLIDKLDEYLGFPRFDPHGDPIPDSNGRIETSKQVCLTELSLNQVAMVCHVSDQSTEMLELLGHKKIALGTKLEVKKKFSFDQSLEIKIRPSKKTTLEQPISNISWELAKNIYVTYDN